MSALGGKRTWRGEAISECPTAKQPAGSRLRVLHGDAMPQRMTITEALTLFAAAATQHPLAAQVEQQSGLGVTATVVRPAKISTIISGGQVEAVTIADSAHPKVLAEGGTVIQVDHDTRVIPHTRADSLTVTIIY